MCAGLDFLVAQGARRHHFGAARLLQFGQYLPAGFAGYCAKKPDGLNGDPMLRTVRQTRACNVAHPSWRADDNELFLLPQESHEPI